MKSRGNVLNRACSSLKIKTRVLEAVDRANLEHQLAFQSNLESLIDHDVFSVRGQITVGLQLSLKEELVFFGILERGPSVLLLRVEGPVIHIDKDIGLCPGPSAEPKKYFSKLYDDGEFYTRVDIARISAEEVIFGKRVYPMVPQSTEPGKLWGAVKEYEIKSVVISRPSVGSQGLKSTG